MRQARYGVVLCGGGPSALGPIFAAVRTGRFDELLDNGIALVEPGVVGPGSLAHYRINANSLGGPFLEFVDGAEGSPFDAVRELPETLRLREFARTHPPLALVGAYLTRLGAVLTGLLAAHPNCAVYRAKVRRVELGRRAVTVHTDRGDELAAERVVVGTGGRPFTGYRRADIVPGLSLAEHHDKVCHAEAFIDARLRPPAHLAEAIRSTGRVVIIGGSHSAWSVVDLIRRDETLGSPAITVVHRTPLRLFFGSADEARSRGYAFDPGTDVCPASGRVNRYGGLRGVAHALASDVLGLTGNPAPVERIELAGGGPRARHAAREAFRAAGAIVMATGYEANLPEIRYADGERLTATVSPTGTVVTPEGCLVDVRGAVHPRVLAYGLGAGLEPSAAVGGESSYCRRADGVWLYQHDIGRIVLRSLLPAAAVGAPDPKGGDRP